MLISWARHHGRTEALADRLDMVPCYVYPEVRLPGPRMISTLVRYLLSTFSTIVSLLRARRAGVAVIAVAPPIFPVLLTSLVLPRDRVIIDAHSGAFVGNRWVWSVPILRWTCRRAAALIVTNEDILGDGSIGCPVVVLHDPFEAWPDGGPPGDTHVLVPLGGGDDEPVDALMEAARRTGLPVILTGRTEVAGLPDNVTHAGFVAPETYSELVRQARVVVGVTDRDLTMQRVGYEAMFAGRALVTSDFGVLRDFFGDAAAYVSPHDARSIADGVLHAWENAATMAGGMLDQRRLRATEQAEALDRLRHLVASRRP